MVIYRYRLSSGLLIVDKNAEWNSYAGYGEELLYRHATGLPNRKKNEEKYFYYWNYFITNVMFCTNANANFRI